MDLQFSSWHWIVLMLAGGLIGMSKAGIGSISIISVSIMAWLFDSRLSTGLVLPLLISADIMAVYHYKRHALWEYLIRLLPWVVLGVILASWWGLYLTPQAFRKWMSLIILISIAGLFYWEKRPAKTIPDHPLFSFSMGLATGFTSMIGNLAGGFSNIYFMSMRISKVHFIGTAAWLFFILNLIKLPFHIIVWKTINFHTLSMDIYLVPSVMMGFYLGKAWVDRLTEHRFRQILLWLTAASSLLIFLQS
jgi:uncharacterized protein